MLRRLIHQGENIKEQLATIRYLYIIFTETPHLTTALCSIKILKFD